MRRRATGKILEFFSWIYYQTEGIPGDYSRVSKGMAKPKMLPGKPIR
jgi:hypothetical protein